MALAINNGGSDVLHEAIGTTSGTSSGTVTSQGTAGRRVGYVEIGSYSGSDPTGLAVTWGGVAMTPVIRRYVSSSVGALFKLNDPPIGASFIAWSGIIDSGLGGFCAFSVSDNNQAIPYGTPVEDGTDTFVVPSALGQIIIAGGFTFTGSTPTVNSPAVMIGTDGGGGFNGVCAKQAADAGSTTIVFGGSVSGFALALNEAVLTSPSDGKIIIQAA